MPRKGLQTESLKNLADHELESTPEVRFIAFDCLHYKGDDITNRSLTYRKYILEEVSKYLGNTGRAIEYTKLNSKDHNFTEVLGNMVTEYKQKGFEGVVVKPTGAKSIYLPKSRTQWIKLKACQDGPADTLDLVVMGVYKGQVVFYSK